MDMLERSVDEPKIAQTIMYKNQHLNSEDDIIQTITAIKFSFISASTDVFKTSTRTKRCRRKTRRCFTWPTATVHWHWC